MINYYKQNREKILTKLRQPVYCQICDIEMLKSSILPHINTKKHLINCNRYLSGLPPIKNHFGKIRAYKKSKYNLEIINEPVSIRFND